MDYEPTVFAYDQAATIWLDEELEDNNSCLSHVPALSSGRRQWEARSVFIEKGTDDCFSLVDRRFYQCRGAGSLFSRSGHYRQDSFGCEFGQLHGLLPLRDLLLLRLTGLLRLLMLLMPLELLMILLGEALMYALVEWQPRRFSEVMMADHWNYKITTKENVIRCVFGAESNKSL